MNIELKDYEKFHECTNGLYIKISPQIIDVLIPFLGVIKAKVSLTILCQNCDLKIITNKHFEELQNQTFESLIVKETVTLPELQFMIFHKKKKWPKKFPKKDIYEKEDLNYLRFYFNY